MNLEFDTINILISLSIVVNLLLGFVVYQRNKKSATTRSFLILTISTSAWGLMMIMFRSASDVEFALQVSKWLYFTATFIPTSFVLFSILFPKNKYFLSRLQTFVVFIPNIVATILLLPGVFIQSIIINFEAEHIIIFDPVLHILYAVLIFIVFLISYIILVLKYIKGLGIVRSKVTYILLGGIVPIFISFITNLILPILGNFQWNWMGQISMTATVGIVTYGILKQKIFDIRVIGTEVLIVVIWFILFIQTVSSTTYIDVLFNAGILVSLIIIGVFLIRSINKEVDSKERLEKLNKRLKELDKKKNEFLHIATHQLRGPITAINGYVSLLRDGDYGKVTPEMEGPIDNIVSASKVMSETIADYMSVARIEEDDIKQSSTKFDLCELVSESAETMRINAENKNLRFETSLLTDHSCIVLADKNNITQVINVLLENAIKYTNIGSITVEAKLVDNNKKVQVSIADTGIGVAKHEVAGLFDKFTRADNAKESDAFGTGMGLFIAKNLIEINGGSIKVSSKGLNKGSTFTIELAVV